MSTVVTTIGSNSLVDPQAQRLVDFLRDVGLPHENIMADPSERAIIAGNLPSYLQSLPAEVKRDARYLSKFVIGAGSGLFDYALNAIWNEVVIDLQKKASLYGLDIFFDAAVGGSKTREFYKTEDDLGLRLRDEITDRREDARALNIGPEETGSKGVGLFHGFVQERHDTFITAAISGNDKAEAGGSRLHTKRQLLILMLKVGRQILDAIVAEISMQLYVERILLIVERLECGSRSLEMIGCE